jgi:hypothetical protein
MWRATITLSTGEQHEVSGTDRDRVVSTALLQYVDDEATRDWMRGVLALTRWSWLFPARRADAGGVTIIVTRD